MSKKGESVIFATIQKVGRSFFLPVSILPIAGLLLGVGLHLLIKVRLKHITLRTYWALVLHCMCCFLFFHKLVRLFLETCRLFLLSQ